VVITGLSGSGKSSLAFDTIYAEGQRRYVESLSAYARQFLGLMEKPDVDAIDGLSPAISIEQKTISRNPRSTVGTVTEVYDYLRLLWARVGTPHCTDCGRPVERQGATQIVDRLLELEEGTRLEVLAPLVRGRKGEFRELFERARKEGFVRVRVDGETYDLADPPKLNRYENHDVAVVVDRLVARPADRARMADSVETALRTADGILEVLEHRKGGEPVSHLFSERYACPHCGTSLAELEPRQFSFNSPYGACPDCDGLGTRREVSPELLLGDGSLSILEGVVLPWGEPSGNLKSSVIPGLAAAYEFDPARPWVELSEEAREAILFGSGKMKILFPYQRKGKDRSYSEVWEGVVEGVARRYRDTSSDAVRQQLSQYMSALPCSTCEGARLRSEALSVTLAGRSIGEVGRLSIGEAVHFFDAIPVAGEDRANGRVAPLDVAPLSAEMAGPILKEVRERLRFLEDVGLEYLTLGRSADTLSGGEGQRIRLATQIGSRLVGVLYILDEPSIGLHQRDNHGSWTPSVPGTWGTPSGGGARRGYHPGGRPRGGPGSRSGEVGRGAVVAGSVAGDVRRRSVPSPVPTFAATDPSPPCRSAGGPRIRTAGDGPGRAGAQPPGGSMRASPSGASCRHRGIGSGKSTLVNETLYRALARRLYRGP
jgi:excinuclease ABC subunit A